MLMPRAKKAIRKKSSWALILCSWGLLTLVACSKHAVNANDGQDGGDAIYSAAISVANHLEAQCQMVGRSIIQLAKPRPGVSDYVRRRQLEIAVDQLPDGCIKDSGSD
jgi:hypothetical protein